MNKIWADRLIAGTKTFADVPASRKAEVKAILLEYVNDGRLTAERYQEIVGVEAEIRERGLPGEMLAKM